MKTSHYAILIAMGAMLFGADEVRAQTQNCAPDSGFPVVGGGFCGTTYATDTDGDLTDNETTTSLDGVVFPGIALTPEAPKPILDANGNQVVDANGRPLYQEATNNIFAQAYGSNATAVGAGARVGQYVPAVGTPRICPNGGALSNNGQRCEVPGPNNDYDSVQNPDYVPARTIPANNGTALGAGAVVEHNGSTAVGAGASSTRENQVVLGTAKDSITAPGIHNGNQYQTGPRELVTTDAAGNLGTDGGSTFQAISANTALLSQHSAKLEEHSKGLAIAMSLPDAWIESNKRFAIAGNIGGFGDETAIGAAAIFRIDETWSVNGKLGADTSFDEFGWTVGARASW